MANKRADLSLRAAWTGAWRDPQIPLPEAQRLRARQVNAVVDQIPIGSISSLLTVAFLVARFWAEASLSVLLTWAVAAVLIESGLFYLWWSTRAVASYLPVSDRFVFGQISVLAVSGVLLGSVSTYLFGVTDDLGRLTLVGFVASFMSIGAWLYASYAPSGWGWTFGVGLGTVAGLFGFHGLKYGELAALTLVVTTVCAVGVYKTALVFLAQLRLEARLVARSSGPVTPQSRSSSGSVADEGTTRPGLPG